MNMKSKLQIAMLAIVASLLSNATGHIQEEEIIRSAYRGGSTAVTFILYSCPVSWCIGRYVLELGLVKETKGPSNAITTTIYLP
jgi:hypothetical protein